MKRQLADASQTKSTIEEELHAAEEDLTTSMGQSHRVENSISLRSYRKVRCPSWLALEIRIFAVSL